MLSFLPEDASGADTLPRVHSPAHKHLLLIGLRGSGKTTLAGIVAEALGMSCADLDDQTARQLGAATAGEGLRGAGEVAFRAAEVAALASALSEPPHVLALGGGTPTAPGAAEMISQARREGRVFVVFLDPPLEVLANRLRTKAGDRPSLTGLGVVEEIAELAAKRRPLYAALADLVVARVDRDALDDVADATPREELRAGSPAKVAAEIVAGFRGSDSAS